MSELLDLQEFLADYLTESGDHLLALDEHLLEAERLAEAGRLPDPALIHGVFRAIHTLKGMAGMMGFQATTELAHEVEHHFDEVRNSRRRMLPEDFPALFGALDTLKRLQRRVAENGSDEGLDVSDALAGLKQLGQVPTASQVSGLLGRVDPHDVMEVLVARLARLAR